MSSPISFNQMAQLLKKFEQMGWDAQRITQLGQANGNQFRAIGAILDGPSASERGTTTHLRLLETTTLAATSGRLTIAQSSDVFRGGIATDFKTWGTNVAGTDTPETAVSVYEMKKDGDYRTLFGSLGDPRSLCHTQAQIVMFCLTRRHLLRQDGHATFFLFEVNGELFVACVSVDDGQLRVFVSRFGFDYVWDAGAHRRLVVPQQKL